MTSGPIAVVAQAVVGAVLCCFFVHQCSNIREASHAMAQDWKSASGAHFEAQVAPQSPPPPQPAPVIAPDPPQDPDEIRAAVVANAKAKVRAYLPTYLPFRYQIVGIEVAKHDQELEEMGSLRYPIEAVVEIRIPTVEGWVKRFASFACDDAGNIIQPLSFPEP